MGEAAGATKLVADVPCSSQASCKIKEAFANRCNYGRVVLQPIYQSVNVLAHVMAVLISALCGCVHVGSLATCFLGTVPQTCVFPYSVYSTAYTASAQLWEAVKATTKTCILHGDYLVASR